MLANISVLFAPTPPPTLFPSTDHKSVSCRVQCLPLVPHLQLSLYIWAHSHTLAFAIDMTTYRMLQQWSNMSQHYPSHVTLSGTNVTTISGAFRILASTMENRWTKIHYLCNSFIYQARESSLVLVGFLTARFMQKL